MKRTMEPRRHEGHEKERAGFIPRFVSCVSCFRGQFRLGVLLVPALALAGTGAAFLKIPVGSRAVGMGEAAAAWIDDASALYYNPAGLANVPRFDLLLSHNQWFLDMNHEYVAGVYGTEALGKFGLGFDYWGSGTIQGVNIRGETIPGYSFSAEDWSLTLGYGRSIGSLSLGLGLKFMRDREESLATSAMAIDAGAMYQTPLKGLKAGLAVANIGTSAKLDSEAYSLPLEGRLGVRYDYGILGAAADLIYTGAGLGTTSDSSAETVLGVALGLECRPVELLALRAGYRTGSDYVGFSGLRAGLGVRWHGIGVDYAFAPFGKLGFSHRIAISYRGSTVTDDEEGSE